MLIHPTHRLTQEVRPFGMVGLGGKTMSPAWQPNQFHINASFFHRVQHSPGHSGLVD